ncbi:MATE family efflux transporter [Anaerosporobacter faecicola]|uniref:MATE family efflux transporter n=1 Tax=Anaerosporobacter faecicola TaxID=2718714 RepID=UPI0014398BD1|nr:MATE family efflux transporter [Anaerosporobacter faecicola]
MKRKNTFFQMVCSLAIPVALQSMLQASFSIVDQIMIGKLGSVSIAGVGLAGKFSSIFSVMVSAIGTVAGIMIAQYIGQKNKQEVRRSFHVNIIVSIVLAVIFTLLCILLPDQIMGVYTKDALTRSMASKYLRILAITFLPAAGATMLSTMFRCMEKATLPLYASIVAALLNTGLNYVLIFGKWGFPQMKAEGAAIATVISQFANFFIMFILFLKYKKNIDGEEVEGKEHTAFHWNQYVGMLLPILVCEFMWSLGENVYAGIYGNLGTESCAAMNLINPIQGIMIGALCGIAQAAGVIVGKKLGNKEYEEAYWASKKLIYYGFVGSFLLSIIIILTKSYYITLYEVEASVKQLTNQILIAYAIIAPFKVANMILAGGIIRSGGKTNYVMIVDLIGTWIFGVPLGLLAAFVWKLSIPYVYFILSLEECVRFAIALVIFHKKWWLQSLEP